MALGKAARRLRMRNMTPEQKNRINLIHGSLTYRDQRIAGFDAGVAMEVVEHIDPPKLEAFEDAVFGAARPGTVIVTTPNVEYNTVYFPDEEGRLRHRDHRFEWDPAGIPAVGRRRSRAAGSTAWSSRESARRTSSTASRPRWRCSGKRHQESQRSQAGQASYAS